MTQKPPDSVEAFQQRLKIISGDLPKRLRQIAVYLSENTDRIAISTVAELSAAAGVQPSALMRFCQDMGFSGFSDMQKMFRSAIVPSAPDYSARLKALRDEGADSPSALLAEFADAGRHSLENMVNSIDARSLDRSVTALIKAECIHLVGMRRSFPVATYLAYAFEKMHIPTKLHDGVGHLDQRGSVRENDVLIAISFAPYAPTTLELVEHCRIKGFPVVIITDTPMSPLAGNDDLTLYVSEADFGNFRSLSATLSLAITLAVAVGRERNAK